MRLSTYTFKLQKRNVQQLFIMYCCALFYIVFLTPNRYDGSIFAIKFIPVIETVKRIHKPAGEHFWRYYVEYFGNIFGNIILFMPFGFLLKIIKPARSGKQIVLYGFLTSVSIELLQLFLEIGVCDIDDVILNITGTAAGVFLYKKLKYKLTHLLTTVSTK